MRTRELAFAGLLTAMSRHPALLPRRLADCHPGHRLLGHPGVTRAYNAGHGGRPLGGGALRALIVARRSAVKARTQAFNQIHALLVVCEDALRDRLGRRRGRDLAQGCSRLQPKDGIRTALRSLGRRWLGLNEEVHVLEAHISSIVRQIAPRLVERHSVGVLSAAQLLVTAGDNPIRLRNEAAFAALCGASPVKASSGKTTRHRLNRGGDRAANTALWTIANVRLIHDPRTRTYAERRTARGNSRKEILRILKRYIVRELFPIILASLSDTRPRQAVA